MDKLIAIKTQPTVINVATIWLVNFCGLLSFVIYMVELAITKFSPSKINASTVINTWKLVDDGPGQKHCETSQVMITTPGQDPADGVFDSNI